MENLIRVSAGVTRPDIRPIAAVETRPLRRQLLRPHQAIEELVYTGDGDADSLHAGAFLDGRLVGIASIHREPFPGDPTPSAWQLNGMATLPEVRGEGYGAALIAACLAHIGRHGGEILWCSGRTSALGFYEKMGFRREGAEYFVPGTGPHFLLWRPVNGPAGP